MRRLSAKLDGAAGDRPRRRAQVLPPLSWRGRLGGLAAAAVVAVALGVLGEVLGRLGT